jgi:hypothetical protein
MTLETALAEIKEFWPKEEPFPFGQSDNTPHLERLQTEFGIPFPQSVQEYVTRYAPATDFYFDTVGNPMCVYGVDNLKLEQDGYHYNSVKKEVISGWPAAYFMIGDEGADPVLVDLANPEAGVQRLSHGAGKWDVGEILGATLGQFLLCAAAQHHALNNFEEDPIVDDERGFCLAPNAAAWYFKNMKVWAGNCYPEWCSGFDNA